MNAIEIVIKLLETTLENMPSREADKIVLISIELLEGLTKTKIRT